VNVLEQQLKRLGEEEAAQVIRRALEIQGEPGTVSLEELRQAANELRIDPIALERALEERLGDPPPTGPERTFFVDARRPGMTRIWRSHATKDGLQVHLPPQAERQDLPSATGLNDVRWSIPLSKRRSAGTIVLEKQDDLVVMTGEAKSSASFVLAALTGLGFWALFSLAFASPGNPNSGMIQLNGFFFGILLGAIVFGLDRGKRVSRVRSQMDILERRLRR